MSSSIFLEYSRHPPNKYIMPDPTIYYRETNRMCADTVQVYMRIADGVVTEFSFDGYMSIVATGSTAIWGEHILGMGVQDILSLREKDIQDILQMEISPRRRNASIIWLLATQNALYEYLGESRRLDFSDIV